MTDLIQMIKNHRSIRNYTDEQVKEKDLQAIIESAIHAPSSINGQQWSLLVVKDQVKKEQLAQLCGGQPWIAKAPVFMIFLMDYYKIAKKMEEYGYPFEHSTSIESIMVGSVDVGIAFSNAMNAAESLGYGIVPIGGVRNEPNEIIALLELPKYVYPVLGMCIGVEEGKQEVKPRLPYEAMVSVDVYNQNSDLYVKAYDETIKEYMSKRTNGKNQRSWSEAVASAYKAVSSTKVRDSLKEQGFTNEK